MRLVIPFVSAKVETRKLKSLCNTLCGFGKGRAAKKGKDEEVCSDPGRKIG